MNRRPLFAVCCCWILGSTAASSFTGLSFWLFWAGITMCVPLVGMLASLPWKKSLILWVTFTCAALYWNYNEMKNISQISAKISEFRDVSQPQEAVVSQAAGEIVSQPERDGDRVDFRIRLESLVVTPAGREPVTIHAKAETILAQVRLLDEEERDKSTGWKRGHKVHLSGGTLVQPSASRNFGGFDYQEYLHREHIHWLFKIKGAAHVRTAQPGSLGATTILGWNDQFRSHLGTTISQLFSDKNAGFMKGLLIGVTDELDPETYGDFSELGLTHILAISGSHVALNIAILFWLLRLLRVSREKALLTCMLFIPFYVLITGFTPSVIRSGVMSMLGLFLLRKGMFKDSLNILAAAALLMLILEPYYLFNVSFQLSFIVTGGLIVLVPYVSPLLSFLPGKIRMAASMTLVAQVVSFPLTIYYFNQFSLLSLAANFIIVPVVGVLSLAAGTAALLLGLVWLPLGRLIAYPVELLNRLTFAAAGWMNERSGFMTIWKSPSLWWIVVYYILVILVLHLSLRSSETGPFARNSTSPDETEPLTPEMYGNRQPKVLPPVSWRSRLVLPAQQTVCWAALIGLLIYGYQPEAPKGVGSVQFIDVGQGDCTLIITPEGRNILVDGGGTVSFGKPKEAWKLKREPYEVGAKVVVPLLKKRGIHKLDAVVLTHADQDHIGGLQAVLDSIPVDALLMNGSLAESKTMHDLAQTALLKRIPIYKTASGQRIKPDRRTILTFLAPVKPVDAVDGQVPYIKEQNHISIAFLMEMDGVRFLFTGDMDEAAEREVTELWGPRITGKLDVLKVAHHGSRTSTSVQWLEYWKPQASVISAGESNSYGHPHPEILGRLADIGSAVHRTDRMGEIQMQVRGGALVTRHKLAGLEGK
ncbi:ComEC/Rec2 family competence protein [Paenibacillus sp. J22TS3]|uniref:ComEC/Rec2 family competence protein n=1 Tax=Paenibacillus sp. J22TS3 TaxID=2807192 RepID=UPI001BD1A5FE|nr:ComEC/Rec2 family competence protein [Paenibacillus sp. J22TS3]